MPEHRPATPAAYAVLESFLWRDFADAEEWCSWASEHALLTNPASGRSAFRPAMRLRKALRSLEATNNGAPCDQAALAELNQMIKAFDIRPMISAPGSAKLKVGQGLGSAAPAAALLTLALEAMEQNVWHRFKLCREPTCNASFYDSSKNATKTWCSMDKCGSRNKMRRLRAKRQHDSAA